MRAIIFAKLSNSLTMGYMYIRIGIFHKMCKIMFLRLQDTSDVIK